MEALIILLFCLWICNPEIEALSLGPCNKMSPDRHIHRSVLMGKKYPRESVFRLSRMGHFQGSISPGVGGNVDSGESFVLLQSLLRTLYSLYWRIIYSPYYLVDPF